MRNLILTSSICLLFCFTSTAQALVDSVQRYAHLWSAHDERALNMLAEDVVMQFDVLGTVQGRAAARDLFQYDRALNTVLSFRDCTWQESQVACIVVEHNDWLQTTGIDTVLYDRAIFTFDDNQKINRMEVTMSDASREQMLGAFGTFSAWAQTNKPEEWGALFSDGIFVHSYENGRNVLTLLNEWQNSLK